MFLCVCVLFVRQLYCKQYKCISIISISCLLSSFPHFYTWYHIFKVRVYEQKGAGMEWHIDDVLYNPEQIEVVYTVDNTSDCSTLWCPHDQQQQEQQREPLLPTTNNDGEQQKPKKKQKHSINNNNIQSVQTTPNSALIIKAGGVRHKVSPLTVGRRTILKMAFVREYAVLDKSMEGHASHHNHGKKKHKNKNTKKKKSVQRIKSKRKKR